jgi:type II secretory pathway predicted ATPase ExeA/septal ring-binding cell division protein DamX
MTMYLEHFGLREAPFRITPHTEFFFSGANRGATLEALLYAITAGEGMVKVTGEVGSGKTMLCRVLMERLPASVETIYLAVPSLTRDEMLCAIAADLDIETAGANTTKLVRALQERLIEMHARGKQVVALIDEAHAMPLATLEEIRLLSNLETEKDKLLQIVLFGQPELDQHLALPHMRQLKERITHSFLLGPLPSRDVHEYVNFRLRAAGYHGPDLFGPEALRIIAEASEGLTRRINIYADKTLLAAFAAGTHTVSADHARAAVSDTQIVMTRRASPRRTALVASVGVAAGVVVGFGAAHFASKGSPETALAAAPATAAVRGIPESATQPALEVVSPGARPPNGLQPASTTVPAPSSAAGATTPAATGTATEASAAPDESAATSVEARLAAGRALLERPDPGYSVQLMVTDARSRAYLERYLADAARNAKPEDFFVVPAGTREAPRFGVLLGSYRERAEAVAVLDALPEPLRQFRPYVRTLDAVRDDARRASAR